jgi:hypothetical protein
MHTKRNPLPWLAATAVFLVMSFLVVPATTLADNGNASPTLSFFSGGNGAQADWIVTSDQPPQDIDNLAIRLETTNGAPTFEHGYAGILVHHVTGIPAEVFPDSSFWNKTPYPYPTEPNTLGSPRLVVQFQNALGQFDGYGDLRQNTRGNDWEHVSDMDEYPNAAWDVMGGPVLRGCNFLYNVQWTDVQTCFAGDTVLSVYIVADAYGIYHLIDDITVNGKTFSKAADNSNGDNTSAGPDATLDPSLLPPVIGGLLTQ